MPKKDDFYGYNRHTDLLSKRVPDAIDWHNTGIPTNPGVTDDTYDALIKGVEGDNCVMEIGSNDENLDEPIPGLGNIGKGPQGNMFGSSAPDALGVISESESSCGPETYVQKHDDFQPIEDVEGFGEPDPGSTIIAPIVKGRLGK
jgi:hypothetical protein